MYMVFNCLYRKYKNELLTKQSHQGRRYRAVDIDREVHINFSEWIRQKVQTNEIDGITDDLRCLAMRPSEKVLKYTAYNVNGFKFRATEREANLKTQNSGVKVIVHFDEVSGQPIGESGGLLGSWLGQLSNDVNLLPINYSDWRMVNPHIKTKVWGVIQSKFWFDDPPTRKVFVMSALENVSENQWGHFVHMRFTEKWKKMQERNTESQKKNIMPHVCGRKSFSRKRNDITIKTGKQPCRAEFFIETRTKPNGSFVCEEAKTRAEKLTTLLGQKSHVTNNDIASLDDEYAQVFGPVRP
ncbi:unnamed protein product [Brassica oleracea]